MAILKWTEEAERWLRDIHEYIAADNPAAAMRVVSGIHSKAQILLEFPEIGYRHLVEQRWEVRVLLYGHYRIVVTTHPS